MLSDRSQRERVERLRLRQSQQDFGDYQAACGRPSPDIHTTPYGRHTCWQVWLCCESAPPVTFHPLSSRRPKSLAHQETFFPQHLLYSYVTRFFQITPCRHVEQACLNRLFRARLCKLHRLGHVTMLIFASRRSDLHSIKLPII